MQNIEKLVSDYSEESFIYDFLSSYDIRQSSITRLRKGDYNLSKENGGVLWKDKLCFKSEKEADLHVVIDQLKNDKKVSRQRPRFIITTDYSTFLAIDTETDDSLDIPFSELPKHFDFFLPWAGMEKSQLQNENPADIKAAMRMGKL